MPGIAGIVGRGSAEHNRHLVGEMIGTMRRERFHDSGTHCCPELGIYVGWVAHHGSFAARHSAGGSEKGPSLALAGECFPPFRTAADKGRPAGEDFPTALSELCRAGGGSAVAALNGLFSGVLVDADRKLALLFNDRYGSERIYWCEADGTTYFASEAKALLRVVAGTRALDEQGVAQLLKYGSTFDERTLFRDVRLLPGGSVWTFEDGACTARTRYFRPEDWHPDAPLTEEAYEASFTETFRRVLPRYLASEHRIGIAVTGGLDTRMIMACLPETRIPPVCYTYAGPQGATLDVRLGARVARACGLEHEVVRVGPDFLANYGSYVDRTVYATDGCAGPLGAHELYLSELARALSPIRLTGNYGSEVLRSMSTFKPLGLDERLIAPDFRAVIDRASAPRNGHHPVTEAAFREVPWHLFGTFCASRSQLTPRTPYLDNDIVELAYRAPASARRSPRSALQLVRQSRPELAAIPTDRGLACDDNPVRSLSRRLFCAVTFKLDYLHKEGLPSWLAPLQPLFRLPESMGLLGLHKFLPYRNWFRRELAGYIGDAVGDAVARRSPYWDAGFLSSVVADHVSGRKNYINEINAILTIEAAERLLVRGSGENR